jgi:hypothetical protein
MMKKYKFLKGGFIDARQFGRIVRLTLTARNETLKDVCQKVGIKRPSEFSMMLNGYKRMPIKARMKLIDYLNMWPLIEWYLSDQEKQMNDRLPVCFPDDAD